MYTLTEEQLKTIIELATLDGFYISREGFNAEYPFDFSKKEISKETKFRPLKRQLEAYVKKAKK